eukprot:jgi/Picsp_1/5764/NSC_03123-R1_sorting nexin-1
MEHNYRIKFISFAWHVMNGSIGRASLKGMTEVSDPLRSSLEVKEDDMLGEEQLEQKRKNNELGDSSGGARERTSVDRDVKLDNNINMYEAERNGLSDGGGQVATSGSESSQDGRLARIRAQEFEEEPRSSLIRDPNLDSSEGASFTIQVSVSDPVKQVADHSFLPGVTTSHYEYLVTSMFFDNLSTSGKHHEVRRRFNDFVALADLLSETKRGYFIFPRPDKGTLEAATTGRSEAEFLEYRRSDLERYLRKLCEHPAVCQGEELKTFLTAEGKLSTSFEWQQLQPLRGSILEGFARLPGQLFGSNGSVPSVNEVVKNARNTNDVLRQLRELTTKMRQEIDSTPPLPEEEAHLRETCAAVESYSDSLVETSRKAEKVIRELERLGSITGDVGLSLIRLAKYEDEFGGPTGQYTAFTSTTQKMASDSRRTGMASVRLSRLERNATEQSVVSLDAIHTQLALSPAVIGALKEREAAYLTSNLLSDDLLRIKSSLSKVECDELVPADIEKTKKRDNLRNEIASLEQALQAAESEYNEIKKRNNSELQWWRKERSQEFYDMLGNFTSSRTMFDKNVSEELAAVAEDLRATLT